MPWRVALLRGTRVFARCDAAGELSVQGGKVEIRYRPGESKPYNAGASNLEVLDDEPFLPDAHCAAAPAGSTRTPPRKATKTAAVREEAPRDAIVAYTDGACSGNPGPAGIGVVLIHGDRRRELSEYLGEGTNNIAELAAIGAAADAIEPGDGAIWLHTDSKYCIGLLTQGWKAKKNQELVAAVRKSLARHADWRILYVPGHSGVPLNERADELAVQAVQTRSSAGWVDL